MPSKLWRSLTCPHRTLQLGNKGYMVRRMALTKSQPFQDDESDETR